MNNPLDALEVAKLATFVNSQLKQVDQNTDYGGGNSVPAARIDPRNFIKQVVQSVNPNQYSQQPVVGGHYISDEEKRLQEMLNAQALSQIPDVSLGGTLNNQPIPNNQPIQQLPNNNNIFEQQSNNVGNQQISFIPNFLLEISQTLKSIDSSIKNLCDYFIIQTKKKKKKVVKRKQSKVSILKNVTQDQQNNSSLSTQVMDQNPTTIT